MCARAKGEEKGAAFLLVCVNPAQEWGVPVKTRGWISGHAVGATASMVDGYTRMRSKARRAARRVLQRGGFGQGWGLAACPLPNWCLQLPVPQGPFLLQNVLANGQGADNHGKNKLSYEKWESFRTFPSSSGQEPWPGLQALSEIPAHPPAGLSHLPPVLRPG